MLRYLCFSNQEEKQSHGSIFRNKCPAEKRYDSIPNILAVAQKFMEHEKSLMEDITKLRARALLLPNNIENIGEKLALDSEIKGKMGQILATVENKNHSKNS